MLYLEERKEMSKIVKTMFDRWLTNAAGGNFSWKVSDEHYIMTASGLSCKCLWDIEPEDVLVVDNHWEIVEGRGKATREINMHRAMYENDSKVKAVVHAHPKDLMVYASMGLDMPIVTEALEFIGDSIPCLPYQIATTKELADMVGKWTVDYSVDVEEKMKHAHEAFYAYAALIRRHGVIVASDDFHIANMMLEILETNAYVHLNATILKNSGYKCKR